MPDQAQADVLSSAYRAMKNPSEFGQFQAALMGYSILNEPPTRGLLADLFAVNKPDELASLEGGLTRFAEIAGITDEAPPIDLEAYKKALEENPDADPTAYRKGSVKEILAATVESSTDGPDKFLEKLAPIETQTVAGPDQWHSKALESMKNRGMPGVPSVEPTTQLDSLLIQAASCLDAAASLLVTTDPVPSSYQIILAGNLASTARGLYEIVEADGE
jgi:hypothetical protein